MKKFTLHVFIAMISLMPLILIGQSEIIVKGKVTDNAGNPLINANVTIVDEAYGSSTDSNGDYMFRYWFFSKSISL